MQSLHNAGGLGGCSIKLSTALSLNLRSYTPCPGLDYLTQRAIEPLRRGATAATWPPFGTLDRQKA